MASTGAKVAAVAGVGAATGLGLWYVLTNLGGGGGCGACSPSCLNGTCSGSEVCCNGVCCPEGDTCVDGTCTPGGGGGLTLTVGENAAITDFTYTGATPGGQVYLVLNTAPNDTAGSCEDLNQNGCVGTASIWDQQLANSSGDGELQEGCIGENGYYWAIYDAVADKFSNWVFLATTLSC